MIMSTRVEPASSLAGLPAPGHARGPAACSCTWSLQGSSSFIIPVDDAREVLRDLQADQRISLGAELLAGERRGYRDRDNQPCGLNGAEQGDRCLHRGPGDHALINEQDRPASHVWNRVTGASILPVARQSALLPGYQLLAGGISASRSILALLVVLPQLAPGEGRMRWL